MTNPWEMEYEDAPSEESEVPPWELDYAEEVEDSKKSNMYSVLEDRGYELYETAKGVVAFAYDSEGLPVFEDAEKVFSGEYKPASTESKTKRGANVRRLSRQEDKEEAAKGFQDESYQARRKIVSEQSPLENFMIHAGQQSDKFLQGTMDLLDYAGVIPARLTDLVAGTDYAMDQFDRIKARGEREAEKDYLFEAMDEGTNVSKLGGALPFYASGPLLTKPANLMAKNISKVTRKVGDFAADQTRGRMGRAFDKWRASGSKVAERIGKETVDPMRRYSAQVKAAPKLRNPLRNIQADQLLRSASEGSLEGLLHYDMAPWQGSTESGLSYLLSSPFRKWADKAPDLWESEPGTRELIEWGKDKGYKMSPGMETGSRAQMKYENSLRGDEGLLDFIGKFDMDNQQTLNKTAWRAAGLENLEPGESMGNAIDRHMKSLKKTYQEIESQSTGFMSPQRRTEIKNLLSKYDGTDTKSTEIREALKPYIKDLLGKDLPQRDPATGRMISQTFSGDKYQHIRSRIQSAKTEAFMNDNPGLGAALAELQGKFDEALVDGMARQGEDGLAMVNRWKDANQKYAITNALVDKGSDVFGNFDPKKYEAHLMSTDAMRTITGKGPKEVQDLQKLTKIANIERNSPSSALSPAHTVASDRAGKTTLGMKAHTALRNWGITPGEEFLTRMYFEGIGPKDLPVVGSAFHYQPAVKGWLKTATTPEGQLWDLDRIIRAGVLNWNPTEGLPEFLTEQMTGEEDTNAIDYLMR